MTPVMWLEFRVASLLKYRAKLLMFLGDMDLRKSPLTFQVSRHCPSSMCLWGAVQWSLVVGPLEGIHHNCVFPAPSAGS